jgi:predicted 3-demethylubiquinone-9 3-methyltransferase (glyoxalase superfamily)
MQKIVPCLWFDHQAEEAANFYTAIFKNGKIGKMTRYDEASAKVSGQAAGSVLTVEFEITGYTMTGLNGGPIFKFTPAVSFFVTCETEEEMDELWKKLSDGGTILMELNKYPWAEKYGWLNDKYGVSWQLMLNNKPQRISPAFLFTGNNYGKAEEAIKFYTSLLPDSEIAFMQKRGKEHPETEKEGTVEYSSFTLNGQEFHAMEGKNHQFTFTEAVSFIVNCETQEEIDKLWEALSAVPESEQCGWLKDKYGVSWQITPAILPELLADPDKEKAGRAMKAMLEMKKLDIAELQKAYEGE